MLLRGLLVYLATSFAFGPSADAGNYYDEVFDEAGQVREQYQAAWSIYQNLSESERAEFYKKTQQLFRDEISIDALPRILLESEYDYLKRGVEQRGRAIQLFLRDYYSGGKKWSEVIPPEVLKRVIERSGEGLFQGRVHPERIVFPYGPDLIRDPDGIWRVLEDNTGNIGGPGDLVVGRKALMELIPKYQTALKVVDQPERSFQKLVERYRSQSYPKNGKIVLYTLPREEESDREVLRIQEQFKNQGVECVTAGDLGTQLVAEADGVYLVKTSESGKVSRERVGYLVVSADHMHVDSAHPSTYVYLLRENIEQQLDFIRMSNLTSQQLDQELGKKLPEYRALVKKILELPSAERERLEKNLRHALEPDGRTGRLSIQRMEKVLTQSPIPNNIISEIERLHTGIIESILEGRVESNYTPGIDFVGDKEFNAYVDDLVRLYTQEEPILRSVESRSFALRGENGALALNEALLREVFDHQEQFVIKLVDGRGGEGIWVGPKISQGEFEKAREAIVREPWRYRAQSYKHLSVLGGERIVDLRMISHVDRHGVYVFETPFGRAISLEGDGKVNISSHGFESPVIVVKGNARDLALRPPPGNTNTKLSPHSADRTWGKVSARLRDRHQINLRFRKRMKPSEGHAYYQDKKNTIFLSAEAKTLGPGDSGFLHEVRHAYEHKQFKQGVQNPFHMALFDTSPQPTGQGLSTVQELYHDHLSADEVMAYSYSNYLIALDELDPKTTPHVRVEELDVVLDELQTELEINQKVMKQARKALARMRDDPSVMGYSIGDVFPDAGNLLIQINEHEFISIPVASQGLQSRVKAIVRSSLHSPLEVAQTQAQAEYLARDQLLRVIDLIGQKIPLLEQTFALVQSARDLLNSGGYLAEETRKSLIREIARSRSMDITFASQAYAPVSQAVEIELSLAREQVQQTLALYKANQIDTCPKGLKPRPVDDAEMEALMKVIFKK